MAREYPREQIIKDGFLKHREPGLVTRWRHRYVMFRTSNAGRFIFTVYKDKPATPANEQTEVPIEEFGGLDCSLKLDGEKHVFAIITVGMTECFAVDSHENLLEWRLVLQEYLGQELVMNVEIPYKQKSLKAGKAQMRIRNTGLTITSLDAPPRCMGSWQILHIRKFGGSDSFRFETGSKCPSGEFLYVLKVDDVNKMKQVFSDLSHHKPIFENDRTGRRMTREHKMLQQFKDRQRVGPRLSLPHNATGPSTVHAFRKAEADLARPRSNALITEDDNQYSQLVSSKGTNPMKTSPSACDFSTFYYNLPQNGTDQTDEYKRKTSSLSATTSPSHGDNLYYNKEAIDLQLQRNMRSRRHSNSDSDDDDFVDINHLRDDAANNTYYNLRDNPLHFKAKAKRCSDPDRPVYENYTPKFKGDSPQPTHRHSDPEDRSYSNLEIVSKRDTTSSTCSLDSSHSSEAATIHEGNKKEKSSTLVEQSSHTPPVEVSTSETLSVKSSSDSEDSESTLRRRTTSIVEHVMISANQNARSCENLLSADQNLWKENNEELNGNHSDSELLNESSLLRKKMNSMESKQVSARADSDIYELPSFQSVRSPNRVSEYDHLELKEKRDSQNEIHGIVPQDLEDQDTDVVSLHRPSLPDESTLMKSFQSRKQKLHLYEDVDIIEDERMSSSCSPESPSMTPIHKQESYKRKVSVLGREHCYESISQQQKSPSPPPPPPPAPSEESVLGKIRASITSPTRFSKKSNSRPTLPLQNVSFGSSFEAPVPSPPVVNANRNAKKPVPTPRQMKNAAVSDGNSVDTQSNSSRESAYVNGSVIKEQLNAIDKPELPPKPKKLSAQFSHDHPLPYRSTLLHQDRFGSSDSLIPPKNRNIRMKPQLSFQENQPNYAQIYVETEPLHSTRKDKSKLSHSTADKRYPPIDYMQIDHFKTEQLQHLIEQRKQEKSFAIV